MVGLFYSVVGSLMQEGVYRKAEIDQVGSRVVGLDACLVYRMAPGIVKRLNVYVQGRTVIVSDGQRTWEFTNVAQLGGLDYQFWLCGRFKS